MRPVADSAQRGGCLVGRVHDLLDRRGNGLWLLVVHHVSRVRDRDEREALYELTHSVERGVIRVAPGVIGIHPRNEQQRSAYPAPARFGLLAAVQDGIDALVSWIGAHPGAVVRRPGRPGMRDELGTLRRQPRAALLQVTHERG